MSTTIQISEEIRDILNDLKMHSRETYNDVLERILEDFQELTLQTKKEIRKATEEFEVGSFKTLDKLRKELGLL
jgi:predicted transcriptional regulator